MAHPDSAEPLLTAEEYARLQDDGQWRDELSRGRLVREPRPASVHGRVQAALTAKLHAHVSRHELGYITVESGYWLERGPDTVRGPDIAFVARSKYGDAPAEKWPDYAPDLAVEILSPSDRVGAMAEKMAQYFGAGARMVWLIDPGDRMAVIYTAAGDAHVIREHQDLAGGDVVTGFSCTLREILDS
jgi:Uma2 family endonuclease